jgi:hypothetical protein
MTMTADDDWFHPLDELDFEHVLEFRIPEAT